SLLCSVSSLLCSVSSLLRGVGRLLCGLGSLLRRVSRLLCGRSSLLCVADCMRDVIDMLTVGAPIQPPERKGGERDDGGHGDASNDLLLTVHGFSPAPTAEDRCYVKSPSGISGKLIFKVTYLLAEPAGSALVDRTARRVVSYGA